jgi:hypothetical protein
MQQDSCTENRGNHSAMTAGFDPMRCSALVLTAGVMIEFLGSAAAQSGDPLAPFCAERDAWHPRV